MGHYRFSVDIAAPPEVVFDLWTDLDRMHEWVEGVSKVTDREGPPGQAGSRYTTWFGSLASRTEVLAAERPRLLRTRFGHSIFSGESQVTLDATSNGTRLTQEFWTRGMKAAIFGRIFATGSWKGSFRGELKTFVKLAEQEAPARTA